MMARRKSLSKYWLYLMTKQVSFTVIYLLLWPHDTKTYLLEDFAAAGGRDNSDGSQQHGGSKILNFVSSPTKVDECFELLFGCQGHDIQQTFMFSTSQWTWKT